MALQVSAPFRIGVDVGGTFTDLVLVDSEGRVTPFKAPSVPSNPTEGVLAAVKLAAQAIGGDEAALLKNTSLFVHGSTVATNTLLEKKGAVVGLLTTAGFRDALEIRRGFRRNVWDHRTPFPPPLVPRYLRLAVTERIDAQGNVLTPVDAASVEAAVETFKAEGVHTVAVSLLHSYRNAVHEQRVREIVEGAWPGVWVTCSSDVAPVIGEYERTSTAVVNAYVAPKVVPYLQSLHDRLTQLGLPNGLLLVQSNGGAISVAEIGRLPVQLILSGPAAGVGALRFFGRDTGSSDLVSIEVGGTSCDVTLMVDDKVGMTDQLEVDDYHLMIPAVEIHTVGAGGGTIARVDDAGLLHAGPQGAGARPGPAAYGFGGEKPTVTDAQLVLGRLKPGPYAGGAISLDLEKAKAAITNHVAQPLGIGITEAAAGIIKLVEQNILHAVERVSIERGYNPRNFTLVAAGGAGPLHGTPVARALGCAGVYIPRLAGVFCAFGMCNADIRHDYVRSWLRDLETSDEAGEAIETAFEDMTTEARTVLQREGFPEEDSLFVRGYDMRYQGQQWTVAVECESTDAGTVRKDFETVYQRLYGYVQPDGQIEIVNLRLAALGKLPALSLAMTGGNSDAAEPVETRPVWVNEATGVAPVAVYDGTRLRPGQKVVGPAVIEELTTTLYIGPGDRLRITGADNYHVELAN